MLISKYTASTTLHASSNKSQIRHRDKSRPYLFRQAVYLNFIDLMILKLMDPEPVLAVGGFVLAFRKFELVTRVSELALLNFNSCF